MVLAVEIGNGTPTVAFAASGWIFQNGQIRHLRRLESVASVDGRRARGVCFRCRPSRSVRPRRAVQSAWAGQVMRLSEGQAKEMMRSADVLWVRGWRNDRPWIWSETFVVRQLPRLVSTSQTCAKCKGASPELSLRSRLELGECPIQESTAMDGGLSDDSTEPEL
jgi:hypothetical protein